MNKVLFGGAFDPIHLGHIHMAEEASKKLDADVIFIPAPISVWKKESAPIKDKIEMIKLSIKDNPRLTVDLFEVESGKTTNYSIETAEYFVKKFPEDKFFYLIGADQVNSFHLWKEAKKLSEIVQIVFFERPNIQLDSKNITEFNMIQIDGDLTDVSSSEIRSLQNLKLAEPVMKYIEENNLYYIKEIRAHLSKNRFEHSLSVANLSYQIAKKNKLDNPEKYYVAGILHDIGKEEANAKEIMENEFDDFMDLPKFAYHQFVGAYLATAEFGIMDKSIINAIKFHATGNENMDILAKVIYAADKIEPTRNYDSSDLIAAMMENAESGFITVLKANVDFLLEGKKDIKNRLTSKCIECYLN